MRIEKVRVEGFRLLHDIEILLEPNSTVIVGRNNSGKTSFTEVFDRFVGENGQGFRLEDFSATTREKFWNAKEARAKGAKTDEVIASLPTITLTLSLRYEATAASLGPLSPFIIDLEVNSTEAIARIEYAPTLNGLPILLDVAAAPEGADARVHFFRALRDTLSRGYAIRVSAIDPTDSSNVRVFEGAKEITALLQCNFIRAQRTLDKAKSGDPDVIGRLLSTLFKTANAKTASAADQALALQLKASVQSIENTVQSDFDEMLKKLLPALGIMGFPSLNDTELRPETSLNVEALLSDHTKVFYAGTDGVHLPEGYNGLGTRNLIYMLLQLESYHKLYRVRPTRPACHLIFIEEPEAHLHPQMQEVFISQLNQAISKLSAAYPDEPMWNVQFLITTHSPHVANAATFEAVRYFLNNAPHKVTERRTKVKDFRKGMATIPPADQEFLHQYMTLTKCDLYFADKAILVEGTTERLLMPRLCEIVDTSLDEANKLSRQYITTIEVGGAYAHLFYPLVDFLELKTLIITDLDSVKEVRKKNKKGHDITVWEKCPTADGARTSNAAIAGWFRPKEANESWKITLAEVMRKTAPEKVHGYRCIAYQIPEKDGASTCARSYEDALVLANPDRFEWPKEQDEAVEAWDIAQGLAKADTALRFAIAEKNWTVPRYIREGLVWLTEPPAPPASADVMAPTEGVMPTTEATA